MVEVFEIFFVFMLVVLSGVIFIIIAALIYMATHETLSLMSCKPLNNETSICYYKSLNNSTKVTTKIIENNE
jgi:hypothetical protein